MQSVCVLGYETSSMNYTNGANPLLRKITLTPINDYHSITLFQKVCKICLPRFADILYMCFTIIKIISY